MRCPYFHKRCGSDCDNHVCRAYFPEKQPIIQKNSYDVCLSGEHESECLIYSAGKQWREERRIRGLTEKCPFASNTVCSHPWEWWCKGAMYPFLLNPYIEKEGKPRVALRDEDGQVQFIPQEYDIHETCLSGNPEIYTVCPNYVVGMELRELDMKLKSGENTT